MKRPNHHPPRRQRGVALIVSLVLLVVITLLGVASLRGVVLEERMASNQYDRSIAFQAAEAALREGEAIAESTKPTPTGTTCTDGVCPTPAAADTPRWEDDDFDGWKAATSSLGDLAGDSPEYIIEFLGADFPCDTSKPLENQNCKRYRVTARSRPDGDERATVMLQSVYATE